MFIFEYLIICINKPVWDIWEVKIRLGKDKVPLSGGLFNREVYSEGLKKRSEALHPPLTGKNELQYLVIMFIYEYLIIFTNLFWAYGQSFDDFFITTF